MLGRGLRSSRIEELQKKKKVVHLYIVASAVDVLPPTPAVKVLAAGMVVGADCYCCYLLHY